MANKIPTALVSDFDGTISDDDFFNYVSRRWLGEKALDPWREKRLILRRYGKFLLLSGLSSRRLTTLFVKSRLIRAFLRLPTIAAGETFLFTSARPAATITSISWRERRWPTAG